MTNYKFIQREDQGTREEQQDSHIVLTGKNCSMLVVCDGLGGMQGGRIASQTIKQEAKKLFENSEPSQNSAVTFLNLFLKKSSYAIFEAGKQYRISPMSTLTVMLLFKDVAFYTHVGDSRIYCFNGDCIKWRTKDHSILQILVDKGKVREEDMGSHPDQSKLYQCLGQTDSIDCVVEKIDVIQNDWFLLCTDGFWENLTNADLSCLADKKEETATALLKKAKFNGGASCDNITFVAAYKRFSLLDYIITNKPIAISLVASIILLFGILLGAFFSSFQETSKPSEREIVYQPINAPEIIDIQTNGINSQPEGNSGKPNILPVDKKEKTKDKNPSPETKKDNNQPNKNSKKIDSKKTKPPKKDTKKTDKTKK